MGNQHYLSENSSGEEWKFKEILDKRQKMWYHSFRIKNRKGISKMTKAELIANVAKKAELTQKDTEAAVNAFFSTVQESLAAGENVQVIGFGTFEVRERAARVGRNPQTGEEIQIAAAKVPAFKPGKALKDAVNK